MDIRVEITGGSRLIPRRRGPDIPVLTDDGRIRPVSLGIVGIEDLVKSVNTSRVGFVRMEGNLRPNGVPPFPKRERRSA